MPDNDVSINTNGLATDLDDVTKVRLLNAINAAFVLADLLDHNIEVTVSDK